METFLSSQEELCRRLGIRYDTIAQNGLFSLEDIKAYINSANSIAWNYYPWAIAEKASYTTATASEYYDYPDEFMSDSIFILKVEQDDGDMDRYELLRFRDYEKYRQDFEDGEDKVASSWARKYFINPNSEIASGNKIEIWGRLKPTKLTADADAMPFSPNGEMSDGNEAIIKIAFSIALESDKKRDASRGKSEKTEAYQMLEVLAERERKGQQKYHTKNTPLFRRIDILGGGYKGDININQF